MASLSSRSQPPTATLIALAAAGRDPTDITLPTAGSQAVDPPPGSHEEPGFFSGYAHYFSQMYTTPVSDAASTVGQAGTALVNNIVTEAKLLPGTVQALPGAYIETAASGQQASGLSGGVAGLTDSLNPFGGGIDFGPQYGHTAEYQNGVAVGKAGGFVINTLQTVSGARGLVTGVQALRTSTGGLVQLAQLRLIDGRALNVIMVNGEAVVATEAVLAQVGINAAAAAAAVANLGQTVQMATPTDGFKEQLFERNGKPKGKSAVRGAQDELAGRQTEAAIQQGKTLDHVTKVRNAQRGLVNRIGQIKRMLGDATLSETDRAALQAELSEASKLLDMTKGFVPG